MQFRTEVTASGSTNDGLTCGHVGPGGTPFDVVGQVVSPGTIHGIQTYALDATGLSLLSEQTGYFLDKTPEQSILDVFLSDDTEIDFVRVAVWYGPNCAQDGTC